MTTWSATYVGRIPLTNEIIGRHWAKKAEAIAPVRQWFGFAASGRVRGGPPKAPRFERAGLRVELEWPATGRAKIPDCSGSYLTVKGCLDELVAMGVLPDDNGDVLVGGELYLPPVRSDRYALTLTLFAA